MYIALSRRAWIHELEVGGVTKIDFNESTSFVNNINDAPV
jgi:hypothetical protein